MILTAEHMVKVFPGVRALDGASLRLAPGSVHALLGENGAGKSTLVKILTGVYRPDGGRITVGDKEVHFSSPLDAQRAGIGVVHQERNLIPAFSIAENVVLHHLPNRWGLVDRAQVMREAQRCLSLLDLDLDPQTPVWQLSVAQAQLVEIAKALSLDSKVLLLDEPTASLTRDEADRLYAIVRKLRDTGHAVVLVSHKLEEVFAVADTVTVLRDGQSVAQAQPLRDYTHDEVVDLMVGRAYTSVHLAERTVDRDRDAGTAADRRGDRERTPRHLVSTCDPARSSACTGWSAPAGANWPRRCSAWTGSPPARSRCTARRPASATWATRCAATGWAT